MPEEINFAQSIGPAVAEHDPLVVYRVDIEDGSVMFRADLDSIVKQREFLLSPATDVRYTAAAKRELHMSEPGVSRRQLMMVDRESGKPVDPRTADPETCWLVHRLWFDSFN